MPSFEATPDFAREPFVSDPVPGFVSSGPVEAEGLPPSVAASVVDSTDPIVRAAYEEGREAGRAEAPVQEAAHLESAAEAFEQGLRALRSVRRGYLQEHRRALVDLALAVAHHVLQRELTSDSDALVSSIERALEQAGDEPNLIVRLSTSDHATLLASSPGRIEALGREGQIELEVDPELDPGDIRVLAGRREVNARLASILDRLREEFGSCVDLEEGVA